jgi:hypothetical protein
MKKLAAIILVGGALTLAGTACKKKESGICYCSYFSGDKKEYNLTSLARSQQIDSCYTLDGYAEAFAGDCELK